MSQGDLLVREGTHMIGRGSFSHLELEEFSLPEGLEEIRAHTFRCCKVRRLALPSTVKKIGFGAFSACDRLEEVILPEGLQAVGPMAFSECENLKSVINMQKSGVGDRAFYEYRLLCNCYPVCGAPRDGRGQCTAQCDDPYGWMGSFRLYKGLFWWTGENLVTVKVHCLPDGEPAYSVRFFGNRDHLGSHQDEWKLLKQAGDPRLKGIRNYNDIPRGRVEIVGFKARVFLHPDLNRVSMLNRIKDEFGLSEALHGLWEVQIINDLSAHYKVSG